MSEQHCPFGDKLSKVELTRKIFFLAKYVRRDTKQKVFFVLFLPTVTMWEGFIYLHSWWQHKFKISCSPYRQSTCRCFGPGASILTSFCSKKKSFMFRENLLQNTVCMESVNMTWHLKLVTAEEDRLLKCALNIQDFISA